MADVRCPMCSKPNPAGVETCQHCHARLKPLVAPSQTPPEAPKPPSKAQGSSDWLGDLRSESDNNFAAGSGDAFDGSEGDWLSRLGQDEMSKSGSTPDWLATPMEKGDPNVPDWMEDLGVSGQKASTDGDDWSQRLQASEPTPTTSDDQDDLKNWLAGLSSVDDTPPPDARGIPDWLSTLGDSDEPQQLSSEPTENIPGWLAGLSGDEPTVPLPRSANGEAQPASDLPDWLTSLGGSPEAPAEDEIPASSSTVPDWLSGLEAPDLGAPVEEPDDALNAIPSWLTDAASGDQKEQFIPPVISEREPPTQPVPDWLSQFEQVAAGTNDELPATMMSPDEELTDAPLKKPFPTSALDTGDLSAFGTVPDWLSDLNELTLADESGQPAEPVATTDWLSGLGDLSENVAEETPVEPTGSVSAFVMGGDILSGDEEGSQQALDMPELEANPEWLSSITAPEVASAEEQPLIQEEGSEATLAELPSWLEAMRPVGAAAPTQTVRDESDGRVESAGPLRGLRGVLQAEPDIANFRKPPVYVNKLQVTEAHQAHIALLEELIAAEGKPRPVQPFVPIKSQIVLRLIIAFGLIAAVFAGLLWEDSQPMSLQGGALPPEITNLRGNIESLPPDSPVLIAIDYEAGSAAEMEYPARVALQNLEQKQAYLAFVSTSLNGPLLSERLLQQLDAQTGITYTNYTVLGYIPGGSSGLLSFARSPRQAFVGVLDGEGWGSVPLSTVHLLSDFALVVVMTDNADTARMWVEQVRPQLDAATPLLMVLSAQTEPMVRPYFQQSFDPSLTLDPNQVQVSGYMAGMAGAAAYQSKVDPQVVWKEWNALAMASLIAIVVIALGGMFNLSLAISSRPKVKK